MRRKKAVATKKAEMMMAVRKKAMVTKAVMKKGQQ